MKITAQDLLDLDIIDGIITEPLGGAHRDSKSAIEEAGRTIDEALTVLRQQGRRHDPARTPREIPGHRPQSLNLFVSFPFRHKTAARSLPFCRPGRRRLA